MSALVEGRELERDAFAFELTVILRADFRVLVLIADLENVRVAIFILRRQGRLVAFARLRGRVLHYDNV